MAATAPLPTSVVKYNLRTHALLAIVNSLSATNEDKGANQTDMKSCWDHVCPGVSMADTVNTAIEDKLITFADAHGDSSEHGELIALTTLGYRGACDFAQYSADTAKAKHTLAMGTLASQRPFDEVVFDRITKVQEKTDQTDASSRQTPQNHRNLRVSHPPPGAPGTKNREAYVRGV